LSCTPDRCVPTINIKNNRFILGNVSDTSWAIRVQSKPAHPVPMNYTIDGMGWNIAYNAKSEVESIEVG